MHRTGEHTVLRHAQHGSKEEDILMFCSGQNSVMDGLIDIVRVYHLTRRCLLDWLAYATLAGFVMHITMQINNNNGNNNINVNKLMDNFCPLWHWCRDQMHT